MTKQEIIKNLQDNLNNDGVFLNKFRDIHNLMRLNICSINNKCGAHYYGYWVKNINGLDWALKVYNGEGVPKEFYYELLSEKIAKAMFFETINSKIVKYSNDSNLYGIMSQDYRYTHQGYDIVTGREIVEDYLDRRNDINPDEINVNSLPIIYEALNYHFHKKDGLYRYEKMKADNIIENIFGELAKRYVFNYITMQKDFHLGNWELFENEQGAIITPMYDMELCFNRNFYDERNTSLKASADKSLSYDEDFKLFYNLNGNLVKTMMYILNPDNIVQYINSIPGMPDELKKDILETFLEHYEKIETIISEKEKNISFS